MVNCSLCKNYNLNNTHYFCHEWYRYLLICFKPTALDLEEYLNLSFRDTWIFNLELCKSFDEGYKVAKFFIPDLKPLINITEYVLLYQRIGNMIRYEKLQKVME